MITTFFLFISTLYFLIAGVIAVHLYIDWEEYVVESRCGLGILSMVSFSAGGLLLYVFIQRLGL